MERAHFIVSGLCVVLIVMACRQSRRNRHLDRAKKQTAALHARWRKQVGEGRIFDALCLAYAHVPESRPYIEKCGKRRVRIVFEKLPDYLGVWRGATNTIALSTRLYSEPTSVTAAILCHEMVHAKYGYHSAWPTTTRETRRAFEEEIHACALEAVVWEKVGERFLFVGSGAQTCHATLRAYRAKQLPSLIMQHAVYQRSYFGRPLKVKGKFS